MEKCAPELVALIVEYACAGDLGKTARSLKLVSKDFYSFAEPLEFRALAIIGLDQLKATITRLEKVKETGSLQPGLDGKAKIDVRHLFICEYIPEDIVENPQDAELFRFEDSSTTISRLADDKRRSEYRHEFWNLVTILFSSVSATLKTLTMLQHWLCDVTEHSCRVLSGLKLPCLEVLTLRQSSNDTVQHQAFNSDNFILPEAPSLKRLHINGLLYDIDTDEAEFLHPLLDDMHSRFGKLSHLIICGPSITSAEDLVSVLCGWDDKASESILACPANRRLPGNLVSATVHRYSVIESSMSGYFIFRFDMTDTRDSMKETAKSFVDDVEALCIDGLEARLIDTAYPPFGEYTEEGEWSFKALLAEWKMGALGQ
ncbi:hypothetical protein M0805_009739 [Coniferiporia weirii]|nr:hypothetical protein M0805_009739 [Coniferiporia weirii]